ncbi:MAG TPA: DUF4298 domain-containing protein [Niabella sp.]|nr:DUF4298 domain-containing protein [Niabella sp.]
MNIIMQDNILEIEKKFKMIDEKMHQMKKDIDFLERFLFKYAYAITNLKEIEEFYYSDSYMNDLAIMEKGILDKYWSASQDGIWNMGIEFRSVRIKLLKMITDHIYEETLKIQK